MSGHAADSVSATQHNTPSLPSRLSSLLVCPERCEGVNLVGSQVREVFGLQPLGGVDIACECHQNFPHARELSPYRHGGAPSVDAVQGAYALLELQGTSEAEGGLCIEGGGINERE
jgi:hypothetical protein